MAQATVTVIARIKAKPDKIARVKEELAKLLAPTRAEDGCINFDMHQANSDAALFLFHETWTSEASLKRHFETPHIKHWLTLTDELLAEPLDVTLWTKVG